VLATSSVLRVQAPSATLEAISDTAGKVQLMRMVTFPPVICAPSGENPHKSRGAARGAASL
jgi:hypothetical protein